MTMDEENLLDFVRLRRSDTGQSYGVFARGRMGR